MNWRRSPALVLVGLTLLADVALAVPALRYGATVFLLWLAPGLVWSLHLAGGRWPKGAEMAVGLGLGIVSGAGATLVLHYVAGAFPGWLLALVANLLVALSLAAGSRRRLPEGEVPSAAGPPRRWLPLAAVVVVAALPRLVNLGYSQFQGDEGVIMVRAAAALMGDAEQLFLHQKGPLEVLVPMATWSLSGTIDEFQARLPFALAGVLGVVGVYLLGTHVLGRRAGLAGGLLLAVNGYFVAFGRIVQYQSLVLATTGLGLLALWLWCEGRGNRWLLASGALLGCGLLAHYDAALALPAAVYLVGLRLWRERASWRPHLPWLLAALALAVVVVGLFYLPFALHPNFANTLAYLRAERVGTGGPVYNNLLHTLPLTVLYTSAYYVVAVAGLLVLASWRASQGRWRVVPVACAVGLVAATWLGRAEGGPGPAVAIAAGALWLAAVVWAGRVAPSERAIWLWFGVPFLFHYFLVWDPRTHVLNAFPAACLLAGVALQWLGERLQRTAVRRVLLVAGLGLYALFSGYVWRTFVDHSPEVQRTWPEHRSALYWTPYDELPRFGLFGFPYQAGWRAVARLVDDGELVGVYASNEEEEITRWYTLGSERTYCPGPDYYLIAARVQDEMAVDREDLSANYHLAAEVRVGGETRLWLYRSGSAPVQPVVYDAEDFASPMRPADVLPGLPPEVIPVGTVLDGRFRLAGYRLDATDARPGGSLRLTLYWEALVPTRTSYQVFTHLYDGRMWGQRDSTPGCGLWPTSRWEPGRLVRDDHVLLIADDAPVGALPLTVGMYDLGSGVRLPAAGPDGVPLGDAILLTTVVLQ